MFCCYKPLFPSCLGNRCKGNILYPFFAGTLDFYDKLLDERVGYIQLAIEQSTLIITEKKSFYAISLSVMFVFFDPYAHSKL